MSQALYIPHPHIIRLHDVYGTVYYYVCLDMLPVHTVPMHLFDTRQCAACMSQIHFAGP